MPRILQLKPTSMSPEHARQPTRAKPCPRTQNAAASEGVKTACARDEYDGMVETLFRMLFDPEVARRLSVSKVVGLVLMIIGFAIAFTAVFTLKRFYASTLVTRVDHRLITHGIYRFVRHPIYLGALLVCIVALPVYR